MLFTFFCAFHLKAPCFSLFTVLFTEKHYAFHFLLCFSLKSTMLFTFHCTFCWKTLHFSLFTALFTEKCCTFQFSLCFSWKATKQLKQQREGQLGICYILVVFGSACSACMCKWCMYTYILTWFCLFSWKVVLFVWKVALFMKSTEKHLKATKNSWFNRSLILTWSFIEYRGKAN